MLTVQCGIMAMCPGFIRNFTDFITVHALLGITEGGLPSEWSRLYSIGLFSSTANLLAGALVPQDQPGQGQGLCTWGSLVLLFARYLRVARKSIECVS